MSEPIVFGSSFAALIQLGLERPLTPAATEALRQAGVDLGKPLLAGYPAGTWLATLQALARELFPDQPADAVFATLGELTVRGLRKTAVGQAKGEMNRTIGAERALERLTRTFRVSNNYVESSVETRGPGDHLLVIQVAEDFRSAVPRSSFTPPEFYLGVLREIVSGWGVDDLRVSFAGEVAPGPGYRYELAYRAPQA